MTLNSVVNHQHELEDEIKSKPGTASPELKAKLTQAKNLTKKTVRFTNEVVSLEHEGNLPE